jgi:hypothetical protein
LVLISLRPELAAQSAAMASAIDAGRRTPGNAAPPRGTSHVATLDRQPPGPHRGIRAVQLPGLRRVHGQHADAAHRFVVLVRQRTGDQNQAALGKGRLVGQVRILQRVGLVVGKLGRVGRADQENQRRRLEGRHAQHHRSSR